MVAPHADSGSWVCATPIVFSVFSLADVRVHPTMAFFTMVLPCGWLFESLDWRDTEYFKAVTSLASAGSIVERVNEMGNVVAGAQTGG